MKVSLIYKIVLFKNSGDKSIFRKRVKNLLKIIANEENTNFNNINIVFCNDEFIREYNNKYLGHDYETDIITFHDKNEEGKIEGELLISAETVKSNSLKFKTKFDEELKRVIIHGVLHLCGYHDKTTSEKIKIRKKENYYIKKTDDAGKGN